MRAWLVNLCVLLALAGAASAQSLRDPTLPPVLTSPSAGPAAPAPTEEAPAILVRDGKSYLMDGSRLYAVGQKIGHLRIERITETEVWLADGNKMHKLPRFAGVERHAALASPSCSPTPASPTRPAGGKKSPAASAASLRSQPQGCPEVQP
jgi:hypothetical protein